MKLLIIAGPYEADRIRKAAVLGGFEAVAIEPGESLSGWVTATRPDVIILAPQIVSGDPAVALAKVRAVPRGRVPIFLVGEAEDQQRLQDLADGFFVRPVSADDLLARAREAVGSVTAREGNDAGAAAHGSGPQSQDAGVADAPEGLATKTPTLRPLVSARTSEQATPPADAAQTAQPAKPGKVGKTAERWPPPMNASGPDAVTARAAPASMFDALAATIEADFDAELQEVVRTVGIRRQAQPASARATPASSFSELRNDSSQKTLKMPDGVTAALNEAGRGTAVPPASAPDRGADPSGPATPTAMPTPTPTPDEAAGRVRACHALLMDGDYFQILGVSRQASSAEIERAWRTLKAELSAASVDPKVGAEWEGELQEIRAVIAEAGRLLGDERLRRQYREALAVPAMESADAPDPGLS